MRSVSPNSFVKLKFYRTAIINNLESPFSSLIVTSACLTNDFTSNAPCLSEAFIRNRNSGCIAYWGSSKEGFFYSDGINIGPSLKYDGILLRYLIRDKINIWGDLANKAKMYYKIKMRNYGTSRWLTFSINPIGDPYIRFYNSNISRYKYINGHISTDSTYIIPENTEYSAYLLQKSNEQYTKKTFIGENVINFSNSNIIGLYVNIKDKLPFIYKESPFNSLYLQNYKITDFSKFRCKNCYIGNNISDKISKGEVSIEKGANVTIEVENNICINSMFNVKIGGEFTIKKAE